MLLDTGTFEPGDGARELRRRTAMCRWATDASALRKSEGTLQRAQPPRPPARRGSRRFRLCASRLLESQPGKGEGTCGDARVWTGQSVHLDLQVRVSPAA